MAPVGNVQVRAGASTAVNLDFRIGSDFHINSHTPKSELLIPTVLKLTTPDQVTIADVKYPPGQDVTFPFSPDEKLSVYSGDFSIDTVVEGSCQRCRGHLSRDRHTAIPGLRSQRLLSAENHSGAVSGDSG